MVVSAKKVAAEFNNNTKKADTEFVRRNVNNEFDDMKEIGTRYSSKLRKKCPFNPMSFRLLTPMCTEEIYYKSAFKSFNCPGFNRRVNDLQKCQDPLALTLIIWVKTDLVSLII